MKHIILENGFECDIPEELMHIIDRAGWEWEWYDMRERFWPENQKATIQFFQDLPVGQCLTCSTVFNGFQQLELMIELLYHLKDKHFEFRIMHGCLADDLAEWYDYYESSICPNTEEYNNDPDLRKKFKQNMNTKFLTVLENHKIIWLRCYGKEIPLETIQIVRDNVYDK